MPEMVCSRVMNRQIIVLKTDSHDGKIMEFVLNPSQKSS
jgi:hypothetical protein